MAASNHVLISASVGSLLQNQVVHSLDRHATAKMATEEAHCGAPPRASRSAKQKRCPKFMRPAPGDVAELSVRRIRCITLRRQHVCGEKGSRLVNNTPGPGSTIIISTPQKEGR